MCLAETLQASPAQVSKLAIYLLVQRLLHSLCIDSMVSLVYDVLPADRKRPRDALDGDSARVPKTLRNKCEDNLDNFLDKLCCSIV